MGELCFKDSDKSEDMPPLIVSTKKRKVYNDQYVEGELTNNFVSPATSKTSSCSDDTVHESNKSLRSPDVKSVEVKTESFETEVLTSSINGFIREGTPTSEHRLMDSSSSYNNSKKKSPSKPRLVEKMPSAAELEEFFAAAEKSDQKRFAEKYNYDIVKDVTLEGKYHNSVMDGKSLDRWALLDFTDQTRVYNAELNGKEFIKSLRNCSRNLGVHMEYPLVQRRTNMDAFTSFKDLENLFKEVVEEASRKTNQKLQIVVCVMAEKHRGYKDLKLLTETKIGIVTQCCLSPAINKLIRNDQFFANLCLKINAKLGGSNFELNGKFPHFKPADRVMFIGADVNHPAPMNDKCPSIAAVVATVNWPAANRYAARVGPQGHRRENIENFGEICSDLISAYARLNNGKPTKIVIFRDGVSEGQFDMVLSEELSDIKKWICNDTTYQPDITFIIAQKRHQTRLFVEKVEDGGSSGNIPPGTVVDTTIVHPFEFDFYLSSHYGGIGTSKPTHYYVLWDENGFNSDDLQQLIFHLCFTFARCTKPVSLVPPVYYADLVAYRGRMFEEAILNQQEAASTSDPSLYTLHDDLKDIMFFV